MEVLNTVTVLMNLVCRIKGQGGRTPDSADEGCTKKTGVQRRLEVAYFPALWMKVALLCSLSIIVIDAWSWSLLWNIASPAKHFPIACNIVALLQILS